MTFIAGQGWGMPFIVSPNYVPQDPEYTQHYKPEQQQCADCNGVTVAPVNHFFKRQVLTCNGVKTIESSKRPNVAPVSNREMDKQYVAIVESLKYTRVINKSTRNRTDIEEIAVGIENFV
jgi:electron transfer flavoprotein alpha subunit